MELPDRRRRVPLRWGLRATLAFVGVCAFVEPAVAHEIGASRFESPLPLSLLFLGAGVTVAATAGWLAFTSSETPRDRRRVVGTVSPAVAGALRRIATLGFFAVVAVAVVDGLVGTQVPAENVATVFVWAVWLKGVAVIAVLAGSPWRTLSPWRSIYAALSRLEGRQLSLASLPDRLGVWPALLGFVLWIGVIENFTAFPRSPQATAGLLAAYALLMVLGAVGFGDAWFRRADALSVLYRLLGRVSPVQSVRTDDDGYRLTARAPWRGCLQPVTHRGAVAFVVAIVYTVSFDGFTNTPEYRELLFAVREVAGSGSATGVTLYVVGLAGFVTCFLAVVWLVERWGERSAEQRSWRAAARVFAPTVLPIAAAYEVAHNYPFVLRNLGQLLGLVVEAATGIHVSVTFLGWLSLPAFWWSQVVLVVGGHVIAVVAAHYVAVDRYQSVTAARRAHLPLVVLMVGYTVLSLWIISRPVVT